MVIESSQTSNKNRMFSDSIKDRIILIIGFSGLLLWLVVYTIKIINFNEYENGALINGGSFIKAALYLSLFSFTVSILLGTWIHYKLKCNYSDNMSKWVSKVVNWFIIGLFLLMASIEHVYFPTYDTFSTIYLIALTLVIKYVRREMLKKMGTECEKICM